MNTKEKNMRLLRDDIAGIIFTSKECREYLINIVSASLDIDTDIIRAGLVLTTPRVNSNLNIKYSMVDAIYENNTSIINIEINYKDSISSHVKNMRYVCHLMLRQIPKNKNDVILKPIYQININNYDIFKKGKFIYKSSIREETLNLKRDDFISIVDINVDFLRDIDYNEIKEEEPNSLERLLYIFVCDNQSELDKLYLGNKIMASVQEKIRVLTGDFAQDLYYDPVELKKQCDYEIAEKDTKITIAKNLINMGMKVADIVKATGLSEKEVNDLIND